MTAGIDSPLLFRATTPVAQKPCAQRESIVLASETDFDGFRAAARRLLLRGVVPDGVDWSVATSAAPGLFDGPAPAEAPEARRVLTVPAGFMQLCREVVLHAEPQRFALLYRLLWRLQHEPGLRHDPLDADFVLARHMAQAVRRDIHKMRAFVRFREVRREPDEAVLHVAWFEPQHHIVEANAPFFVKRFATIEWAILTPLRSARWDGRELHFGPGATKQDAPKPDAGEALWLTYYEHIFNPARLKLRAMEKEMPRRYWKNLPEAGLISALASTATERSGAMAQSEGTVAARRLPRAAMVSPAPEATSALAGVASFESADLSAATPSQRSAFWLSRQAAASACRECPLGALATQTVWGEGQVGAPLMLVGEQPGDQEDLQGRPFVGPAGKMLARAMVQLGWARESVYITNAVKHFKYEPRGKRRIHKTPAQREADACLHWLEGEIATVRPKALVALGATAARQLLGRAVPVMRSRGQWLKRADGLEVLVTLHPSALLRADPVNADADFERWLSDLAAASGVLRDTAGAPLKLEAN